MRTTYPDCKSMLFLSIVLLSFSNIKAQVKIGNNPNNINSNSLLEMESSAKGVLLPRSTTAQINAMTAVPKGMILFNTTDSALYLRRDTGWVVLAVSQLGVNPTLNPSLPLASPSFADFYAIMPSDNPATVTPGAGVAFPQDGPVTSGITRAGPASFNLQAPGTYQVTFNVSINEPAQLVVVLNGLELLHTVAGRATGTSQVYGISLITTDQPNSILEIKNPSGSSHALTITQLAGGSTPVAAHLVINKLL